MQDTQQTSEQKLDRFEIYKATIGEFVFHEVENKLHSPYPHVLYNIAKICIGLYFEERIEEPVTIWTANNQYSLHPGTNRYLFSQVFNLPLEAYIINRWGTTAEQIKYNFPDAQPFDGDMEAYISYVHKFNVHRIKPGRSVKKHEFSQAAVNTDFFNDKGLVVYSQGEIKAKLGNRNFEEVEVDSMIEYVKQVLRRYTDYEG